MIKIRGWQHYHLQNNKLLGGYLSILMKGLECSHRIFYQSTVRSAVFSFEMQLFWRANFMTDQERDNLILKWHQLLGAHSQNKVLHE